MTHAQDGGEQQFWTLGEGPDRQNFKCINYYQAARINYIVTGHMSLRSCCTEDCPLFRQSSEVTVTVLGLPWCIMWELSHSALPALPQTAISHSQRHGAVHQAKLWALERSQSQLSFLVAERYTHASILSLDLTAAPLEAEDKGLVFPLHALTDVVTPCV